MRGIRLRSLGIEILISGKLQRFVSCILSGGGKTVSYTGAFPKFMFGPLRSTDDYFVVFYVGSGRSYGKEQSAESSDALLSKQTGKPSPEKVPQPSRPRLVNTAPLSGETKNVVPPPR